MTYTFKLARRLAVSRTLVMLPAILLFAACNGGDATAPENSTSPLGPQDDWRPREAVPVTVSINPSSVTVETNQLIRFLAYGRNSAGDSVYAPIIWRATGGTILPDGRFSSAAVGTFMVTGTTRTRGDERVDTAIVSVVRRQIHLGTITVTPETATLAPGVSQAFSATGHLKDGRAVPIGVNWSATGGSIDAGGNYVAGDTAGTYLVIGTNTAMTLADTATVTITAPPPPPPPPAPAPPPEPPAPTLASITLKPGSATLAPSATRQFTAYGRTTAGDSVPVNATFTATGGTITADGLYAAGTTAGTFRVIATSGALADTSAVTVTLPLGSGPATGLAYGAFGLILNGVAEPPFSLTLDGYQPDNIIARIDLARSRNFKLVLAMTGGAHENYMTNGVFDRAKWNAKMNLFNTTAIKTAVAGAVADGTIIGASVMDEPHVSGSGADGNTWGPPGTMTKARVDSLCGYVKTIFPTLPAGVVHRHDVFEPTKSYRVCDFVVSQYSTRLGSVTAFRDGALAMAQRDGHAIMFSMNILNGGTQDKDGTWDCAGIGAKGQDAPNCQMTADQLRDYGLTLGPAGCGLLMWRYDSTFMSKEANKQAFSDVAQRLATAPAKSCRRS